MLGREGSDDAAIMSSVRRDYRATPLRFSSSDIVIDIGCHIGAFACLVAERGAAVVGYEANRENYNLARLNTAAIDRIRLHHAAIWRSDLAPETLLFTPSPCAAHTGSGSVLFASGDTANQVLDGWNHRQSTEPTPPTAPLLSTHAVAAIGLDAVLEELGDIRLLKIDAEGAEFPILLTATRLEQVGTIVGEYHEFTEAEMERLTPTARVGTGTYTVERLAEALQAAGFSVDRTATALRRGVFTAVRRTQPSRQQVVGHK